MSQELTVQAPKKKMSPRCPNPYIEPSSCCSSCIWSGPRRHLLEMPPYALPIHTMPAHTPDGISGHLCTKHVHRWISCALARSVLQSSTGSGTPAAARDGLRGSGRRLWRHLRRQ